jgi:hypothetical protein
MFVKAIIATYPQLKENTPPIDEEKIAAVHKSPKLSWDVSETKKDLGIEFRSLEEMCVDTIGSILKLKEKFGA